jgi:tripartite-type tricarboxylate transporter receptor subunit TctC
MMKQMLRAAGAVALSFAALAAVAQDAFPNKPVKLVVPYAAGGPADLLARSVAEKLAPRLGQPVVVENKPGAGGHLGGEQIAKGPADGYTLMLGTIAHHGAAKLYKNLRYDPTTELQTVIVLAEAPSVLIVNANSPVKSVNELLAAARSKPGSLSYASAGNGSAMHMAAELLRFMTQIDYVHVPYRGGAPAMADLLGGQVHLMFDSLGTAHPHIKAGKVRPLAVTSTARNASLPDVPTLAEAGVPGYSSVPWYTIAVAKGTPAAIVEKLNAEINVVLKNPEIVQRWEAIGMHPLGGTVADAAKRNQAETTKWTAVINAAKLQAE